MHPCIGWSPHVHIETSTDIYVYMSVHLLRGHTEVASACCLHVSIHSPGSAFSGLKRDSPFLLFPLCRRGGGAGLREGGLLNTSAFLHFSSFFKFAIDHLLYRRAFPVYVHPKGAYKTTVFSKVLFEIFSFSGSV